eukprot:tig00000441_g702.t1
MGLPYAYPAMQIEVEGAGGRVNVFVPLDLRATMGPYPYADAGAAGARGRLPLRPSGSRAGSRSLSGFYSFEDEADARDARASAELELPGSTGLAIGPGAQYALQLPPEEA